MIKEYQKIQDFLVLNHTKESMDYLKNRGLNLNTIKTFGLGFIKNEEIFNTPKVRNSITIPFYDLRNRIVAFFCRSIENNGHMKYVGSHNFKYIYEKSRMFFNLNRVLDKYYNRKVFITEGQIDTMSLHQAGLKNAIAVIGNKMSDIQQEIIYRYFDRIYLVCDGDEAGDNLLKVNKHLKDTIEIFKIKINYPGCKDVNDLLIKGVNIKKYFKRNLERIN